MEIAQTRAARKRGWNDWINNSTSPPTCDRLTEGKNAILPRISKSYCNDFLLSCSLFAYFIAGLL